MTEPTRIALPEELTKRLQENGIKKRAAETTIMEAMRAANDLKVELLQEEGKIWHDVADQLGIDLAVGWRAGWDERDASSGFVERHD